MSLSSDDPGGSRPAPGHADGQHIEIIDAQVHVGPVTDSRWFERLPGIPHTADAPLPVEAALVAMDALGVDAAVVDVYDGIAHKPGPQDYGAEVAARYPTRIAAMRWYDPFARDVEELVASTRTRPGVLATRVVIHDWENLNGGAYEPFFTAAEKNEVPLFATIGDRLDLAIDIPRRHPDLMFVIDHLGMNQRNANNPPFARLAELLAFAKLPNVAAKFCSAPAQSRGPYPYRDVWPALHRIVEAFGPERLMWASDFTERRRHFNYSELLDFLRYTDELGDRDKELILGASLRRLLRWPRIERS